MFFNVLYNLSSQVIIYWLKLFSTFNHTCIQQSCSLSSSVFLQIHNTSIKYMLSATYEPH